MKKREYGKLAQLLKLPADVAAGEAFVSMLGNGKVKVENHCGLMECTDQSVGVKLKKGMLRITGEGLMIREMLVDAMEVTGKIKSVEWM
jgi:sporulation protein YqfC